MGNAAQIVGDDSMVIVDERMYVDGSTEKIAENVTQLEKLTNGVLDLSITPRAIAHCNELVTLNKDLKKVKASLSAQSKTVKLWIQFLEYIKVIKDLISFERLGMWENHLLTVSKFLNLFAATGHIYAKSARLYLQEMQKLPTSHPWLYSKFVEDGFYKEAMWHEAMVMQEKALEMCDRMSRVSRSDQQQHRPCGK